MPLTPTPPGLLATSLPIIGMTAFVRTSLMLCYLPFAITGLGLDDDASGQENLPPVNVIRVRQAKARSSYPLLGTVMPRRASTIGCAVDGRVRELLVTRGERLNQGDPIAQLQTDVATIELAAARAELRLSEQQLGELKAGSRQEDIAEAAAQMEAAGAIAQRAASQLKRMKQLVASRAASEDEVDIAIAEAESTKLFHQAAIIAQERLIAGPRVEQVAQAQAQVDLRGEQVRLLEDRLNKHTIVAPFDGYVTMEHTEAGAWVTSGGPVVDLIELDVVEAEVAVPAAQVVSLRPGQSIRVECPERAAALFVGQLERIVPAASTRARTFPVLIRLENQIDDGVPLLMSGMLVRIELPVGPPTETLLVPTDAIVLDGDRHAVFVVEPDAAGQAGVVRRVSVQLGVADGDWVAIQGELDVDQLVVTRGNERLTAGQQVAVKEQQLASGEIGGPQDGDS